MVYDVIRNVQKAMAQRGGWRGLLTHMYTNGDYPFKFGTLMGTDAAGNKYYENRVDYPFGQHRWVEPGDTHNFDSASIPPEWHGWMVSQNDTVPETENLYFEKAKKNIIPLCNSDAPVDHGVGHQEPVYHFHHLHNQTSVRSRGYGIGNPIVGLPPGVPDGYYTQPGSPYNIASRKKKVIVGDLDEDKGDTVKKHRVYTSEKWADRLRTPEEKKAIEERYAQVRMKAMEDAAVKAEARRMEMRKRRGHGTIVG